MQPTERIVFATKSYGSNAEIASMPAGGGPVTRLTRTSAHNRRPRLSPDGQWIAFESHRDGNAEVYRMRVDGSDPERLTNEAGEDMGPDWSPDGTELVLSSDRVGTNDLWRLDLTTRERTRLTDHQATSGVQGKSEVSGGGRRPRRCSGGSWHARPRGSSNKRPVRLSEQISMGRTRGKRL